MSPTANDARSTMGAPATSSAPSRLNPYQKQLLKVADEERRRIGQELHDVMGQELAGLAFMSDSLVQILRRYPAVEIKLAETLKDTIKRLLGLVRTEAWGLVPIEVEAQEFVSALSGLAAQIGERFGVDCQFVCEEPFTIRKNVVATNLYRIAQESVTNAIKHGAARRIDIRLSRNEDRITLQVQDNGIGIRKQTAAETGMGLQIMRFRAGLINATLNIEPVDEGGVRVTCVVKEKGR